ncbi:hypothetical protein HK405_000697, partial [Cladochytrium tenue]
MKDQLSRPDDDQQADSGGQDREGLRQQVAVQVQRYKESYQQLKDMKLEIEHMQHLLEQARLRLTRAFEDWYVGVHEPGGGSGGGGEEPQWAGVEAPVPTPPLKPIPAAAPPAAAAAAAAAASAPVGFPHTTETATMSATAGSRPPASPLRRAAAPNSGSGDGGGSGVGGSMAGGGSRGSSRSSSRSGSHRAGNGDGGGVDADVEAFYRAREALMAARGAVGVGGAGNNNVPGSAVAGPPGLPASAPMPAQLRAAAVMSPPPAAPTSPAAGASPRVRSPAPLPTDAGGAQLPANTPAFVSRLL